MENKYLYHYTDVESLVMILKSKAMRLKPLNTLDDLQEEKSKDIDFWGQYYFVSSWVGKEQELIPMWKMYGKHGSGVRIKMRSNPFRTYFITHEDIMKKLDNPNAKLTVENFESIVPIEYDFNSEYCLHNNFINNILIKVEYTDNYELLNPQLIRNEGHNTIIKDNLLGSYKNQYWGFQEEWRYKLEFFPYSKIDLINAYTDSRLILVNGILGRKQLPFDHFDLYFNDEAFKDMEIMLSPEITDGNREIVNSIVRQYNPDARIVESDLNKLIR